MRVLEDGRERYTQALVAGLVLLASAQTPSEAAAQVFRIKH
jgi:hypothetical protein